MSALRNPLATSLVLALAATACGANSGDGTPSATSGSAVTPGANTLAGHVPAAARGLSPVGELPPQQRLHLTLGLPLRDQAGLQKLIAALYDPASPSFRQFVTPAQFANAYAPAQADYDAVVAFANRSGFTVTDTFDDRTLVGVDAAVADVERALHVKLGVYQHPTESRTFFAPESEPSIDAALPIVHVTGLDDLAARGPSGKMTPVDLTKPRMVPESGTWNGLYVSKDLRAAYAPGVTLTGAGQIVGIYNPPHGFNLSDITAYESAAGISPPVWVTKTLVDGVDYPPDNFSSEVTLDIEMAVAMAPGLSRVIVYEGDVMKALHQMATDDVAKQLSYSWPTPPENQSADQIYMQFAAQGQSFFVASSDDGGYYPGVPQYADDPYVTVVGGTELSTTSGGAWSGESCWVSSGGGWMGNYPIPSWQQGIDMTASFGSTQYRNSPDVSMVADYVMAWYKGAGQWFSGTSASAPLWAGFTALANQQAASLGQPPVGFLNPRLYSIGKTSLYGEAFHDVASGNNVSGWNKTPNASKEYVSVPGYDLCTGWGTPTGGGLIDALAGIHISSNYAPAAASTHDGALFLATAPDGRIFSSRVVLGQASQRWLEVEGGGRTNASPAAALTGNAPYVFVGVKGLDGNMYINQGDLGRPYVGWGYFGIQTNVAPAVATTPDGVLFFATRTDGHIFSNRVVLGQAAQGWNEVGGGGVTDAAPAAALCGNNPYIFAAVKGLDGNVYINQAQLGGGWVGWRTDGVMKTNVAPAVVTTPDGVIFFATRTDGRIFSNRVVLGQAGQGWVEVGGGGVTNAATAGAVVGDNPYLFTLVKGMDDNIWLNQEQLGGSWVGWERL
jgi:hypothetical protein